MAAVRTDESSATYSYTPEPADNSWSLADWTSYGSSLAGGAVITAGSAGSSLASGATSAIAAAGAPIAETASATRYVAVGATIAVVAIVIAVLAVIVRTYV